ncbi:winged helix-turn-helix domain-containing tetratricopeptide repeat protein [Fodinicurvata halophila]
MVIPVEPRTFDLIALLARNIDRTVTKDEIFQTIWEGRVVSDAALSSQVRSARRALGDDGLNQSIIATVHGRGFRLRSNSEDARSSAQRPATGESLSLPQTETPRPTVAVLPCANLDEDGRGAILAQGLTEDLINALSKNRWLRVITRSPTFALSRATDDISEIARKLGADYLVTGSIRRAGSRVRTTMQATDTRTMRCIWSEGFDREMRDIFELQEEISGLVSSRIATELGIEEQKKAARVPHTNLGAWELYQLGSAEFYRFTPESNRRCQELMRQAIREDPAFADPHSRLAYAMILEMVYFEAPIDAARMDEAARLAEQGVALDDQDANTFFSLGRVRLARREYNLAIDALEHAITLNPCHALSHCGLGDSLAYEECFDEAFSQFDHAIELSPHDPFRWAFMSYRSLAHLFAGQFEDSALWARRASQVPNAHYWARAHLVSALGHLGGAEQASTDSNLLLKTRPGFSRDFAEERLFFVKKRNQLETFLEGLGRAGIP